MRDGGRPLSSCTIRIHLCFDCHAAFNHLKRLLSASCMTTLPITKHPFGAQLATDLYVLPQWHFVAEAPQIFSVYEFNVAQC